MKKHYFLFLLFIHGICHSQNLVSNGDFEQYSTCPVGLEEVPLHWFSPSTASPDYFNVCATSSTDIDIPVNMFGSQSAYNGTGYCGIYLYVVPPYPLNYREYIEAPLMDTLEAGHTYHFEMYVSCAEKNHYVVNSIGAYFSDTVITGVSNYVAFPYVPQISSTIGLMTDTAGWMLVSGDFVAAGGEKHIIIGSFNDDAHTGFQQIVFVGGIQNAYYYVDGVSITERKITGVEEAKDKAPAKIYPNPFTDELYVAMDESGESEIIIYDVAAQKLLQQKFNRSATVSTAQFAKGIYFYEITSSKGLIKKGKMIHN